MVSGSKSHDSAEVIFLHGERYERDRLSAAFEDLPDEELQMLAANIEANGQTLPITINSRTGRVIDGWQRLRACKLRELKPMVVREDVEDPAGRVMALNVHRRGSKEPNAGQKILRAIELWDLDPPHKKRVRKGRTRPWPRADWMKGVAGVSDASYSQLKYVLEHDAMHQTSFEAEIRSGRLSVSEARNKAKALQDEADWDEKHGPSDSRDVSFAAPLTEPQGSKPREVVAPSLKEDEWKEELRQRLIELSPSGFERFSAALLKAAGYIDVKVTGGTGDGGIDGTAIQSLIDPVSVAFQCKRYQGSVGASDIRNFRGSFIGLYERGLIITTGTFTRGAKEDANGKGGHPVRLIDGDTLCDLLKEHRLGVYTEMIPRVTIDDAYFDQFEDSQ